MLEKIRLECLYVKVKMTMFGDYEVVPSVYSIVDEYIGSDVIRV